MNDDHEGDAPGNGEPGPVVHDHDVPAGDPSSERLAVTNLVKQYFNICNAALMHGTDGMLRAALPELLDRLAGGDTITLEVTGTGEQECPRYTTKFADGQFTPIREGTHSPQARFQLSQEFLEDVERNASEYIEHPERLDWSWLRGRSEG